MSIYIIYTYIIVIIIGYLSVGALCGAANVPRKHVSNNLTLNPKLAQFQASERSKSTKNCWTHLHQGEEFDALCVTGKYSSASPASLAPSCSSRARCSVQLIDCHDCHDCHEIKSWKLSSIGLVLVWKPVICFGLPCLWPWFQDMFARAKPTYQNYPKQHWKTQKILECSRLTTSTAWPMRTATSIRYILTAWRRCANLNPVT